MPAPGFVKPAHGKLIEQLSLQNPLQPFVPTAPDRVHSSSRDLRQPSMRGIQIWRATAITTRGLPS